MKPYVWAFETSPDSMVAFGLEAVIYRYGPDLSMFDDMLDLMVKSPLFEFKEIV